MKPTIHITKRPNREDAFWYRGDDIAQIKLSNGNVLYAETSGEIQVAFEEEGNCFKGGEAVEEAERLGLTDEDLNQLNEHDGWRMNNWFHIIMVDGDNVMSDDLGICHDYDEAITLLKEVYKEQEALLK